ncbi:MAG: hypothetical protein WCW02_04925 [Candidatus Buchananbacteria bacterium]
MSKKLGFLSLITLFIFGLTGCINTADGPQDGDISEIGSFTYRSYSTGTVVEPPHNQRIVMVVTNGAKYANLSKGFNVTTKPFTRFYFDHPYFKKLKRGEFVHLSSVTTDHVYMGNVIYKVSGDCVHGQLTVDQTEGQSF